MLLLWCQPQPLRLMRYEEPRIILAIQLVMLRLEGTKTVKACVPVRCPRYLRFPPEGLRGRSAEQATFERCAGLLHDGGLEAGHFQGFDLLAWRLVDLR